MADKGIGAVEDHNGSNATESSDLSDPDSDELYDPLGLMEKMERTASDAARWHRSMPTTQNGPGRPRNLSLARIGSKRYKCSLCGMTFALPRVHETHKMIEHNIEATWKCTVCGMQFLHGKSYNLHVSARHNMSPYRCEQCSQGFSSKQDLKVHKKTHVTKTEKPSYKCEHCPAEYPHLSKLRYHQRRHTGERPFHCNFCDLAFATSSQRLNHINRAHRGIRRHLCDHCGKKFCGPRELKEHYRTHTGERPFVCPVCSRAFTKRNALVVHLRQHTGEKPYVCDQCGQAFTVRVSLRTHLKNKHNVPDISAAANKPIPASRINQGDNTIPPIGRPKRNPPKNKALTENRHAGNFDSILGSSASSLMGQHSLRLPMPANPAEATQQEQSSVRETSASGEGLLHQEGLQGLYRSSQPSPFDARTMHSPFEESTSRGQSPFSEAGRPLYPHASALAHATQNNHTDGQDAEHMAQRYVDHRSAVLQETEAMPQAAVSYGYPVFPPKY